jgi:hypothetical protein
MQRSLVIYESEPIPQVTDLHASSHLNDRLCGAVFVVRPVCGAVKLASPDHSPLASLEHHKPPELRAVRVVGRDWLLNAEPDDCRPDVDPWWDLGPAAESAARAAIRANL